MDKQRLIKGAAFLLLVFVAAFAGVFAGMKFREARAPQPSPPPVPERLQVGNEFPDVPLVSTAGEAAAGADLLDDGGVVMFLRLDCQPCGRMVSRWQELAEAGELEGVTTIGITGDEPALVEPYRQEKGLGFPIYVDPDRRFVADWGVRAVPLVVVVGPEGEITRTFSNPADIDPDEIRREAGAA